MNMNATGTFTWPFLTFCICLRRAARRALENSHCKPLPSPTPSLVQMKRFGSGNPDHPCKMNFMHK